MTKEKILVCFNEPVSIYDNYIGKSSENPEEKIDLSEKEFSNQIEQIKKVLSKRYSVEVLSIKKDIVAILNKIRGLSPDIIFNFVEAIDGNANYESYIAGVFEILEMEFTGNESLTLGNCLNKPRTKQVLQSFGIKTPDYHIVNYKNNLLEDEFDLNFPVILKLVREDASIGISEYSVAENFKSMKSQLNFLFKNYKQDILIEEYIKGREINAAILGNRILPLSEITFNGLPNQLPKIVTYEAKWSPESIYYKNTIPVCPANIDYKLKKNIERIAMEVFKAMECRDYARIDFRVSNNNVPYVIEVNPNPDITIDSGFARSAAAASINYEDLLYTISDFAITRGKNDKEVATETQATTEITY